MERFYNAPDRVVDDILHAAAATAELRVAEPDSGLRILIREDWDRAQHGREQVADVDAARPVQDHSCVGRGGLDADTVIELKQSLEHETLKSLLAAFFSRLDGRVEALREAVDDSDRERIKREAHSLKGAAASLGCRQLAAEAARLEQLAPKAKMSHCREQIARIERGGSDAVCQWRGRGVDLS